jgi:hypothetical protein
MFTSQKLGYLLAKTEKQLPLKSKDSFFVVIMGAVGGLPDRFIIF